MENTHNSPKVGLALGSGGARGLAHIGILKVFEEHHIPVDLIAGSSIGALVGALYSVGHTPQQMSQFTTHFPQKFWVDYSVPKMGFIKGDKIKEIMRLLTKRQRIEDASIPLSIVATNLQKGERRVFSEGPIAEAVRASISIPGIFVPEKLDGEYYVDGGVIDRVPVSVVKKMGADFIIAVDVSYYEATHPITSIFDVIAQSIDVMEREILRYSMVDADIMIRPQVGHYSINHFSEIEALIKEGEKAAQELVPQIKVMLESGRENQS
ncbi:patatin-like phospholipase family protein [Caldalkalibacillus salinus]|uniref:patatin-like phospholipase family protein n=1 Tax=Caldalkalibacillus salinus TaxID=2803787 RepID=UPI001922A7AC|nr:patatin-like phospholipase family protein [Caldalkalibacillus salinus]